MINIKKLTNEEFLNRLYKINSNIEILSEYINSSTPVKCKCKIDGYEWNSKPDNLLHGKGCKICWYRRSGKMKMKSHKTFVEEMNCVNKFIEIIGQYNGANKNIECNCLIHNETFYSSPTHLLNGQTGCLKCIAEKNHLSGLKSHEQFIKELYYINTDIVVIGEYIGAKNRINVECKRCGHEWNPEAYSLLSGCGCPKCRSSKGEEVIRTYLSKNNIKFIWQKKFENLRGIHGGKLSYDFYLPEYNTLIEYQGEFHDGTANIQTEEGFIRQKKNDEIKKEYATLHNINFIEIWYYNFSNIEEILFNYINNFENPVTTTAV